MPKYGSTLPGDLAKINQGRSTPIWSNSEGLHPFFLSRSGVRSGLSKHQKEAVAKFGPISQHPGEVETRFGKVETLKSPLPNQVMISELSL